MRFASAHYLLLLAVLPLLGYYYFRLEMRRRGAIKYSDVKNLRRLRPSPALRFRPVLSILRLVVLALLIIAMARPQKGQVEKTVMTEGIDISLALDCSYSMKATDFQPNRFEAAKKVVADFIDGRKADRINVLVFATTSFLLCPLTLDYAVIKDFLSRAEFGIVDGNSTAIGMALANCVNKLKDSTAKNKVIILLTDGENNAGKIDPLTAAETAKALGIRVYTIGVGSESTALVPVQTVFGTQYLPQRVSIDEKTLQEIAQTTGGRYYRATDEKKLSAIYKEIDQIEKTKIKYHEYHNYDELVSYLLIPALGLLLLEVGLANTRFLRIP
jgi:Ca-activated chloride channel family protein